LQWTAATAAAAQGTPTKDYDVSILSVVHSSQTIQSVSACVRDLMSDFLPAKSQPQQRSQDESNHSQAVDAFVQPEPRHPVPVAALPGGHGSVQENKADSKNSTDRKDSKDSKDGKDSQDSKESKETKSHDRMRPGRKKSDGPSTHAHKLNTLKDVSRGAGRRWLAFTGDASTQMKMQAMLDQFPDSLTYIPGALHWSMVHTRLANGLIFAVMGDDIGVPLRFESPKARAVLTNCTDTHKAQEFTEHCLLSHYRERAAEFLRECGNDSSAAKDQPLCDKCLTAVRELLESQRGVQSDWHSKVRTVARQACNDRYTNARIREKQPAADAEEEEKKHKEFRYLLRAAKRRELARSQGFDVPVASPLQFIVDVLLCSDSTLPALSNEHARAVKQLCTCSEQCLSAERALTHSHVSSDAVTRNLVALYDEVVGVVVAEHHAVRHDDAALLLATRKALAPFLSARGHDNYDILGLRDFAKLSQLSEGARQFRHAFECVTRSSAPGQHQGLDAEGEQVIARLKHSHSPSDSASSWTRRVAAFDPDSTLRSAVNASLGISGRPRRPRSIQPTGSTLQALAVEQRRLLRPRARKALVDLANKPLALSIDRLKQLGVKRVRELVNERFLSERVAIGAKREAKETACVGVSAAETQPSTTAAEEKRKSKSKSKSKSKLGAQRPPAIKTDAKQTSTGQTGRNAKRAGARRKQKTKEDDDGDWGDERSIGSASSASDVSDSIRIAREKKKQTMSGFVRAVEDTDEDVLMNPADYSA
jgi:hypothetical protein